MSSSGRRRDLLQLVFAVVVPEGLQGQVDLVELTPRLQLDTAVEWSTARCVERSESLGYIDI